jgi:hypothetical protein
MKVYALKENVRKYIHHPKGGYRFDQNGEADWPDDQFTQRRIIDGDISLTPPTPSQKEVPAAPAAKRIPSKTEI